MSEQIEERPVRPWHWPRMWAKDEKFWRDVASRTASGLLILLIGYAYAVVAGYVSLPEVQLTLNLAVLAIVFTIFELWFLLRFQFPELKAGMSKTRRRITYAGALIINICFVTYLYVNHI
jgi:hypothetical protein